MAATATSAQDLHWYHVLELPSGETTPGFFDCRPIKHRVPIPASLAGRRCLDVGTWDGYWAFEMERRGAEEVVAIDLADPGDWDWPPDRPDGAVEVLRTHKAGDASFAYAHGALGSKVERRVLSVYDLSPETAGTFDFCYLGTVLMHLRDPVAALTALRSVCTGEAVVADGVEAFPSWLRPRTPTARLEGSQRPWWWQPNRAALIRIAEAAGWEVVEASGVWFMPLGPAHPRPAMSCEFFRAALTPEGRERLLVRFRGVPHVSLRLRP